MPLEPFGAHVAHIRSFRRRHLAASLFLSLTLAASASAEEGMWPFNMVPSEVIEAEHGFTPSQEFLDHARLSSVRFNNGGSGSFVSPRGLVMTNQHVGRDCIQKLTGPGRDLMAEGFYAATPEEELKCPDLELNQTVAITDVTAEIVAAADAAMEKPGEKLDPKLSPAERAAKKTAERNKARKAKMGELEKACADEAAGIRCDVVTLYSGGAYHLYRYQKLTDVRLMWAPENDAKHFGGEQDNFSFPRMSLDVAFFRAWKDGAPVESGAHYFKWSQKGALKGDLVFVAGHPGSTGRLSTPAELTFLRDTAYPYIVDVFTTKKRAYEALMKKGPDQKRNALAHWLRAANAEKAITGYLKGLHDAELIAAATARHDEVRARLDKAQPPLADADKARLLEAWPRIEKAYKELGPDYKAFLVTEGFAGPSGRLLSTARHLVRMSEELKKPDGERLREYQDAALPSLELQVFSEAPMVPEIEALEIALGLEQMRKVLGDGDPTVKALLAGKTPEARAEELVKGTTLYDVEVRRQLHAKGKEFLDASQDPMLLFVKAYDQRAQKLRQRIQDGLEAEKQEVAGRVAEAWAKAYGQSVYPDATFTLRLSYGVVGGYREGAKRVPWATYVGDLYRVNKRSKNQDPYQLPQRFLDKVGEVDFSVPYNFVSTNDIIGGNSGSPVFNRQGELVGLIFDGNIHQLSNRFVYREEKERAVSVHSAGILHMLERVYEADALVAELASGADS